MDAKDTDIEKENKKAKLIYSGELVGFAVVFLVLGILILVNVIKLSDRWRRIFTWVTLVGGAVGLGDFFWALFSKKRRKKVSMLDKALMLPVPLALIPIDIISLVQNYGLGYSYYQWTIVALFFYIAAIYAVEGIYHWYVPVPGLLDDVPVQEEKKEEDTDNNKDKEPDKSVESETVDEKKEGKNDGE